MVDSDAGAAEFQDFIAQGFVGGEIEFRGAVVAETGCGHGAGLEAVGADYLAGFMFLDNEVIALGIEGIRVEAAVIGGSEAFAELDVEDRVAKALSGADVVDVAGGSDPVTGRCQGGGHLLIQAEMADDHIHDF